MKVIKTSSLIYNPYIFLFFLGLIFAQQGSVVGTVVSDVDQTPIHGVNIYSKSLSIGTVSKVDGTFILDNLPHGDISLTIAMIGFKEINRSLVLRGNRHDLGTIAMSRDTIKVEEIVVDAHHELQPKSFSSNISAKKAAIVIDFDTEEVLFEVNADTRNYPASLTKIMTLYILFDYLKNNIFNEETKLKVSKIAASRSPSKLYLEEGSTIKVKDAILALIIKSANDVATVVAEHISGTERDFAKLMNKYARNLGMKQTTFKNASGLPNRAQMTTARDIATLSPVSYTHLTLPTILLV